MANTVVGFTINIDGINNIQDLNKEIKTTKEQLKGLDTADAKYAETATKLAQLQAEQKAVRKSQNELTKSFLEGAGALSEYDKASAKLNRLRKEYKELVITGKEGTKDAKKLKEQIGQLDKTLKGADASVGQFGRNVGNYPRIFGLSSKALGQFIPGLDKLSAKIDQITGGTNVLGKAFFGAFVAFKAGQAIGRVIDDLSELDEQFRETANAVQQFSDATGETLDALTIQTKAIADTFGVSAEQISEAAASVANNLGISFNEALDKVEQGLLTTTASSDDFLNTLKDYPGTLDEITQTASEYNKAQGGILKANKDLAAAQLELTKAFDGVGDTLEVLKKNFFTALIQTFLSILNIFKPVITAFQNLGASIGRLFKSLTGANEQGSIFSGIISALQIPLQAIAFVLETVASAITFLVDGFTNLINSIPFVRKAIQGLQVVFQQVRQTFEELPFIFAGIVASIKQLGTNITNFFKVLALDSQIFIAQINKTFGAASQEYVELLRKARADVAKESKSIGQAFSDGFNEAKEEADRRAAERQRKLDEKDAQARTKAEAQAAAERAKQATDAAKKRYEQLLKERKKFLEQEAKFVEQQGKLLLSLQKRTNDLLIQAIGDEQTRLRAQERDAFKQREEQLNEQLAILREKQVEREKEAARLFGENSDEFKALQAKNLEIYTQTEEQLTVVLAKERQNLRDKLLEIDKQFEEKALQQQKAAFDKQIMEVTQQEELLLNAVERQLAKGLISEEEAAEERFQIRKESIEKEIQLLKSREETLRRLADAGIDISEDESNQILRDKEFLYTELAKLDKGYTDQVEAQAQARIDAQNEESQKRLEKFQADVQQAAEVSQQLVSIFDGFLEVTNQRRLAQIEKQEQANQEQLEDLNERLQTASGLERRFLEQEVARNKAAAEQIAEDKEKAERQRAKQEKARAIIESIIATALAVVKALPLIPLAVATGIAGAAATATIAAQPLADGGVVGVDEGTEIVQFANGGKVTSKGNIKPLSNGDNVLATLKTGEVVLNKPQQQRVGYATLRSAGIPGFATGGVVGAPTSLIQSSNEAVASEQRRLELLEENVVALKEQIPRIEVVWTANTEDEAEKGRMDKKQIKANATF